MRRKVQGDAGLFQETSRRLRRGLVYHSHRALSDFRIDLIGLAKIGSFLSLSPLSHVVEIEDEEPLGQPTSTDGPGPLSGGTVSGSPLPKDHPDQKNVPKPPTDDHPNTPQRLDTHLNNPAKGKYRPPILDLYLVFENEFSLAETLLPLYHYRCCQAPT